MEVDIQFQKYVQKMCRSCLNPNVNLTPVLDRNLKELFRKMTDLEVTVGGIFPLKLCDSCIQILTNCQRFRESCRTNDMVVKFNYKIKTEKGYNETENVSLGIVKSDDVSHNTVNVEAVQDIKPVIKDEFLNSNNISLERKESPISSNVSLKRKERLPDSGSVSLKRKESPPTVTAIKILKRNVTHSPSSIGSNVPSPSSSWKVNVTPNSSFNGEKETAKLTQSVTSPSITAESTTVLELDSSINMETINETGPNKKHARSKSKEEKSKQKSQYVISWRAKRVALQKKQEQEFLQNCKDNNFKLQPKDPSAKGEPCLIPWDQELMAKALEAVCNNKMTSYQAYRAFSVPKKMLEKLFHEMDKSDSFVPKEIEEDLVEYCDILDKRFFGASEIDVIRTVYQLFAKKRLNNPFMADEVGGKLWYRSFKEKNNFVIHNANKLKDIRAKMVVSDIFPQFFDIFEEAVKKIKSPSRLFNCDSAGIKIIRNGNVTPKAGESDCKILFTLISCMNPNGKFVPPLLIFPKQIDNEDLKCAPEGSIYAFHPSGSLQKDMFIRWFLYFVKFVKPTKDDPVVLVYDGCRHFHSRNIDIFKLARQNHVEIVCLPPQGTHLIQPIEIIFMKTFKACYSDEVKKWKSENPDKDILQSVGRCHLLTKAYERAATPKIAAQGFKICGLYPCNRNSLALDIS